MNLSRYLLVALALLTGCGQVDSRWEAARAQPAPAQVADQTAQALADLTLEVRRDPKSSDARIRLANEYLKRNYLREAGEHFRKAAQFDPQNPDALTGLAQVLARLNDVGNILPLAQKSLLLDAGNPSARVVIEEATHIFEAALVKLPGNLWLALYSAIGRAKLRQWDKAQAHINRATAAAPGALPARLLLGNLYLQQGALEQAAAEYEQLAEEQPTNPLGAEALGRLRWEQKQYAAALEAFRLAEELRPDWIIPYVKAGYACLQLQLGEEATRHFQKALERAPRSLGALLGLAESQLQLDQRDKAIATYERLLADYPNQLLALNNLANLYAQADREPDRALQLARAAVALDPGNGPVRDTLGSIALRQQLFPEAITNLQLAVQLTPANGRFALHLGQALLGAGRRMEAKAALHNALTRGLPASEKAAAEALLADL